MTNCDLCGEKLANSAEGLKNHNKRFHGGIVPCWSVKPLESYASAVESEPTHPVRDGSTGRMGSGKVVPYKVSYRPFLQIVQEVEWAIMGKHVFPDTRPVKC